MIYVDLSQVYQYLQTIIAINSCILSASILSAFISVFALLRLRKGVV